MITQVFSYVAPSSVDEALDLLKKHRDEAKIIAGGQSLVPLMNLGVVSPRVIVDLNRIKGLSYIREDRDYLYIGPTTTHTTIEASPMLVKNCTVLSEAAAQIADPLVRNRGTIGGSVCHSDPAADYLPVLVALDAEFKIASPRGRRHVHARDFFKGPMYTVLGTDEILMEVKVPKLDVGSGSAYIKLALVEGGFALANCAGILRIDRSNVCTEARFSIGGVESKPMRLDKAESALTGKKITEAETEKAGDIVFQTVQKPMSDIHAEAPYRREMARVLTKRVIRMCLKRCGASSK